MFNQKRLRRFHLKNSEASLEGIARRRPVGGHYLVERAKWLNPVDDEGVYTQPLDGFAEIPKDEVLYVQVIG